MVSYSIDEFRVAFHFYKISKYQIETLNKNKTGFKLNIGFGLFTDDKDIDEDEHKTIVKAKRILTKYDIYTYMDDVFEAFQRVAEKAYLHIFDLNSIYIDIYKTKALNGSSYIALPEYIANKKAVINIKNEDNNCFIYSVLCGYLDICDKSHPERVNHYTNHMKLLKYDEKDMPMKIDKIMHFEKRNNLKINVFGKENGVIYPLYVSYNRHNEEFKLINL